MANEFGPSVYERVQRDESGFIQVLVAKYLGGKVLKLAAITAGGAVLAYGPVMAMWDANSGLKGEIAFKGKSKSDTKILAVNPNESIDIADAYYATTADVTKIETKLTYEVPVLPDISVMYPRNTQMRKLGRFTYKLPNSAVTPKLNDDGETDFVVDASKMTVLAGSISPAVFEPYTIDDGKKNFGDRQGFREQSLKGAAALNRVINMDTLGNVLDDIDAAANFTIESENDKAVLEKCPDALTPQMPKLISDAIKKNLLTLDQNGKFGEVKLVNEFKYSAEPLPAPVQTALKSSGIKSGKTTIGSLKFTEVTCTTDEVKK